jgi:hypothetical protein
MDGNVILYGGTAKIRSGSKERTFRAIGQLPLRQKDSAAHIERAYCRDRALRNQANGGLDKRLQSLRAESNDSQQSACSARCDCKTKPHIFQVGGNTFNMAPSVRLAALRSILLLVPVYFRGGGNPCHFISAATVRMQAHAIGSSEVPAGPVAVLEHRRGLPRQNGAAEPDRKSS